MKRPAIMACPGSSHAAIATPVATTINSRAAFTFGDPVISSPAKAAVSTPSKIRLVASAKLMAMNWSIGSARNISASAMAIILIV